MKDIHSTTLFRFGITASLVFNLATTGILFSRYEIFRESLFQATIGLSLLALLVGSVPVFGGMAIVARRVQRQTTRDSAVRCLARCWIACFLILCLSAIWAKITSGTQAEFPNVQFLLAFELGFVALMLCFMISLNLLLRYLGLHRDEFPPTNPPID